MNFSAYYKGGMGLHPDTIEAIFPALAKANRIIEFGSGASTAMMIDTRMETGAEYTIDSFDHSEKYCYSGLTQEFLTLRIRQLISTDDDSFNWMFTNRALNRLTFHSAGNVDDFRAHNCFYDISDGDISGSYDIVILDGPNGNGRSIAFLHLIGRIGAGALILIDDYFHYDFVERCKSIFSCETVDEKRFEGTNKGHILLRIT